MSIFDAQNKLMIIRIAIEKTVAEAEKDGKITKEEGKIIEIARRKLLEFEKLIQEALEDNIITQEERNDIIDFEEKLMEDIYFQAAEDGNIDDDEKQMLKTLFHSIDPKASLDWLDSDVK